MAGFDGLDSNFASRLQAMIAASGGLLGPGSGRRSIQEQIKLRISNGCPDVWTAPASSCRIPTAIPGQSEHNHGFAMDLVDTSTGRAVQGGSAADEWLRANAANFGLHMPVKGEAWHVEMIEGGHDGGGQVQGAIGFDMNGAEVRRNPEDELSARMEVIKAILTGGTPDAETPEDVASPIATETTVVGGERPAPMPAPSGEAGGLKGMVQQMAADMGWGDQWGALDELVQRESSWNPNAQNPTSTAFGLFQFLDSTWDGVGASKTSDPAAQARAGLAYIKQRYGSPAAALAFHDANNWY